MTGLENIASGEKILKRVYECSNPITQKIISIVSKIDYDLFIHKDETLDTSKPIFTLILTIYESNIKFIKESLNSVFSQTYKNTEIILINNGALGETKDLVWKNFMHNKNSKLICTKRNLYNPNTKILSDPIPHLWNAGLFCSKGDFVYFISYDDFLSPNYTEEMVQLFIENKNCFTAAPLVVSINEFSEINQNISVFFKKNNLRSRYTNGISLAKSYMNKENKISFPGGLLAVRTSLVLECGGFDNQNDLSQLFKFAIHGDSGFAPNALLYWRHHTNQANKKQSKMGLVYYRSLMEFNRVYNMKQLLQKIAGWKFAQEYQHYINNYIIEHTISSFKTSYNMSFFSGLKALLRILIECPFKIQYKAFRSYIKDFPNYFRKFALSRHIYHNLYVPIISKITKRS